MIFSKCYRIARVAELVDALDLGSSSAEEWEFESPLSHHFFNNLRNCRDLSGKKGKICKLQ